MRAELLRGQHQTRSRFLSGLLKVAASRTSWLLTLRWSRAGLQTGPAGVTGPAGFHSRLLAFRTWRLPLRET